MDDILKITVQNLAQEIDLRNANVGRKLVLALSQLGAANSVEEYQQVGILIRDAWIEFGQSIFRPTMVADGTDKPSPSDAKRLVKYALKYYTTDYQYLVTMASKSFDLANRIQHDVNVISAVAWQLLSGTALWMTLINDVVTRSALYVERPYYKCPNCGSLKLESKTEGMLDFDGPAPVDVLRCIDCEWYYIEALGGMSGIGEPPL